MRSGDGPRPSRSAPTRRFDDPILQARLAAGRAPRTLDGDGDADVPDPINGSEHVVIGGTERHDTIIAGDGDDTIWGKGGNDTIEAGYGVDKVFGGDGDDIITNAGTDIGAMPTSCTATKATTSSMAAAAWR